MRKMGFAALKLMSRAADGYFDEQYWHNNYLDVIEFGNRNNLNPGQQAIFEGDYSPAAQTYCIEFGQEYDPDAFMSYVQFEIGDAKYNAISEIIEESSQRLYELWDHSYGGDGVSEKRFRGFINE